MFLLQLSNAGRAIYLLGLTLTVIAVLLLRSQGKSKAIQLGAGAAIYIPAFIFCRKFKKED